MKFLYSIMGNNWTIKVLRRMPKGMSESDGVTYPNDKVIVFNEAGLSLSTIIHELVHAYYSYQCIETAVDMNPSDFEEIHCEFMAKYSSKILNDAITILLLILEKKKLPISNVDRSLIGDLYELQESLNVIGERLNFDEARNEE